jgi:hypothetical protein
VNWNSHQKNGITIRSYLSEELRFRAERFAQKQKKTTTMNDDDNDHGMIMRERRVVVSKKLVRDSQHPIMELSIHYSMYGIGTEVHLESPEV